MELYHSPNSAASQKVRLVLYEKRLPFEERVIDLLSGGQFQPDYVAINPEAVVPSLVDDGKVLVESTLIVEYLEDRYPARPLRPDQASARYDMRRIMQSLDGLHQACGDISYAVLASTMLELAGRAHVEAQISKMPNATNQAHRRSVMEQGVRAPEFRQGVLQHRQTFAPLNERLTRDYLFGDSPSLADCALLIYVARVDHLGLTAEVESQPNLWRWYQQFLQRETVAQVFGDAAAPIIEVMGACGAAQADEIREILAD